MHHPKAIGVMSSGKLQNSFSELHSLVSLHKQGHSQGDSDTNCIEEVLGQVEQHRAGCRAGSCRHTAQLCILGDVMEQRSRSHDYKKTYISSKHIHTNTPILWSGKAGCVRSLSKLCTLASLYLLLNTWRFTQARGRERRELQ